jgi:hypothetical protein
MTDAANEEPNKSQSTMLVVTDWDLIVPFSFWNAAKTLRL